MDRLNCLANQSRRRGLLLRKVTYRLFRLFATAGSTVLHPDRRTARSNANRQDQRFANRMEEQGIPQSLKRSSIGQINDAALHGPLAFDAATSTVPFGEAADSAIYWIHPDNLDEARTLLLRHTRDAAAPRLASRVNSEPPLPLRSRDHHFLRPTTWLTLSSLIMPKDLSKLLVHRTPPDQVDPWSI